MNEKKRKYNRLIRFILKKNKKALWNNIVLICNGLIIKEIINITIKDKNTIEPILKVDSILSSTVLNKKITNPYLNNNLIIYQLFIGWIR